MVLFGTRSIAKRLGYRSPQSVINRHEKRNEINPLPMFPRFKGRNWVWCSDDALLVEWQRREAALSRHERITRVRYPRRKHRKTLQEGFPNGHRDWTLETLTRGKEGRSLREEPLEGSRAGKPLSPACTCGTAIPCTAHDEVGQGINR